MNGCKPVLVVLAALHAVAAAVPAWADPSSPAPVVDSLRRCAREQDERQRLACFDSLVKTLPAIEQDQFGLTADIAHQRDPAAGYHADNNVLQGKIAGLRQATHGEWIFILDNRQVWIQAEPDAHIQFAVGEPVRIEHGAMGSLWLAAGKGRKTRVKRMS